MRMLIDFNFPLEPFNTLVRNGTVGQKIQQILEEIKPEAVYFSERGGKRGGIMIVDVADPSKVPAIAEPCQRGVPYRYGARRVRASWP